MKDKPTQTGLTRKEYMRLYVAWYRRVNHEKMKKYSREYMRKRRQEKKDGLKQPEKVAPAV